MIFGKFLQALESSTWVTWALLHRLVNWKLKKARIHDRMCNRSALISNAGFALTFPVHNTAVVQDLFCPFVIRKNKKVQFRQPQPVVSY